MENNHHLRLNIMILLCQCFGITNISAVPNVSLSEGVIGCTVFFTLTYVFLGIPLLYMESVVSQFTNRDCIDVWKISRFTSHVGYIIILWQVIILVYNHTVTSFIMHYLLISFENPTPFYTCGEWSNKYCNIFYYNYTINKNCLGKHPGALYCEGLYRTFPEFQYWRYNLVKLDKKIDIAWKVSLASAIICSLIYLSCFRGEKSLKWAAYFLASYPLVAYFIILTGSLLQKGVVVKFPELLGFDFKKFRITNIIERVAYNLGIGTGVIMNLSSNSSFRTPCLSNSVICVVVSSLFSILTIFTTALMTCPHAFVYDHRPETIIKMPMSFIFEKVPSLLHQYENKSFYLIATYSCYSVLGLCTDVMVFYNLVDVVAKRNRKIAKYPGLSCFCGALLLFLITIPLLNYFGINIISVSFRRYVLTFTVFIAMLECIVFLSFYGVQRFSEDVHFMLGVQPQFCIKIAWFFSSIILGFSVCAEMNHHLRTTTHFIYAAYTVAGMIGLIMLSFMAKILYAAIKKQLHGLFQLQPTWGPKAELLQRSRAMFSVQAMTKEYMYRQYHLQAGIQLRQKNCNIRNSLHT